MPQYMLSVYPADAVVGQELTPEELQEVFGAVDAFNQKIMDEGLWVFGGGLEPPEVATVVDAVGGKQAIITDGRFGVAKEQVGGFWVLAVPDHDAALALAAEASAACMGRVEVRPFQPEPPAEG
jgi:hypothetical protein